MTAEQIQEQVSSLGEWFHNLDLQGVRTAPNHFLGDYPSNKWRAFCHAIPGDLQGKSVLDVGCNAGFYSMEMKRRGAARVLGIDFDPTYLAQARFAADVNGLDIEFRELSVYDVASLGESFDVVLFMGVLYHLRHPLLALDLLRQHVVGDMMVFQSLMRGSPEFMKIQEDYPFSETDIFADPRFPRLYFIERRYSHDPTNWWIPNLPCAEAMLRSAGFEIIDHPEDEALICRRGGRPDPSYAVYPARGQRR
jgi:tRNA (mo5U34)-methyltransferase